MAVGGDIRERFSGNVVINRSDTGLGAVDVEDRPARHATEDVVAGVADVADAFSLVPAASNAIMVPPASVQRGEVPPTSEGVVSSRAGISGRASLDSGGRLDERVTNVVCHARYAWDCSVAAEIAWCEMGQKWNPSAIGAAGERGGFQIHPIHASKWPDYWTEAALDFVRNAEMAYDIWLTSGFGPWSCYRGAY